MTSVMGYDSGPSLRIRHVHSGPSAAISGTRTPTKSPPAPSDPTQRIESKIATLSVSHRTRRAAASHAKVVSPPGPPAGPAPVANTTATPEDRTSNRLCSEAMAALPVHTPRAILNSGMCSQ